jgi:hypothetical protein
MEIAGPHVAEEAFGALLHRLASPLGAIANYAFLLPEQGAADVRAGLLEAMASARGTLLDAQRWLDAVATTHGAIPDGGVDLADVLRAAAERQDPPLALQVPELPRVALPTATAVRLAEALLEDAVAAGGTPDLRVEVGPEAGVHVVIVQRHRLWTEAATTRAFDLFSPRDSGSNDSQGELAVVGSLARHLGGRAWGTVGPAGEAIVHLLLPAEAPPPEQHDEERRDA